MLVYNSFCVLAGLNTAAPRVTGAKQISCVSQGCNPQYAHSRQIYLRPASNAKIYQYAEVI